MSGEGAHGLAMCDPDVPLDVLSAKEKFLDRINSMNKSSNAFQIVSTERYNDLLKEVEEAKTARNKTTSQYRRIRRYDIINIGGEKKLIAPLSADNTAVKYYVSNEELFDIIHDVHRECGHAGRDITMKALGQKYANVTREAVSIFLELCETCYKKRKHPKKGLTVKPLLFEEINSRGQVDLIDLQASQDGEFRYVLNYQDHLTKFVMLRALKTKSAKEVAHTLVDIFCILGAPSVLQSDNGREFVNQIVNELGVIWPELKIVHGKPRHSQSQGSIERCNQDVENILYSWMEDNNTTNWSEGLRFCQLRKNNRYHSGIRQTPFEAMFGRKAHIGLQQLPDSIKNVLLTEENLEKAISGKTEETVNLQNLPDFSGVLDALQFEELKTNTAVGNAKEKISKVFNKHNTNCKDQLEAVATGDYIEEIPILHVGETSSRITTNNGAVPSDTPVTLVEEFERATSETGVLNNSDLNCAVCEKETSGAHKCCTCKRNVHAICGQSTAEEGYGVTVLCYLCARNQSQITNKKRAYEGLKNQAQKMVSLSNKKFHPVEVGSSVTVPVPAIDRNKTDARNLMGVIKEVTEDGFYQIGTDKGTIKSLFSRNQFATCKSKFVAEDTVPDVELSVRQLSTQNSAFGGQGFLKCNCSKKCVSNTCKCRRSKLLCNSKCHNSGPCCNK